LLKEKAEFFERLEAEQEAAKYLESLKILRSQQT
jgi:hypothetical protein